MQFLDYTNGLRVVGSTRHHLVTPTPQSGRFSIYFPETEARFFQVCFGELDPKEIRKVELFERREFTSNLEEMAFDVE